jgi:Ca-activated chloride channel homolog
MTAAYSSTVRRHSRWLALAILLLASGQPLLSADDDTQAPSATANPLAETHQRWLEEVDVILSAEELAAFLSLSRDYQRDAFIERFWKEREIDAHTGRNEARERWQSKVDAMRQLFGSPHETRSRNFLVHGPPEPRFLVYCKRREPQIELWFYPGGSEEMRKPFPLIFYRPYGATRDFRLHEPGFGTVDGGLDAACEPGTLSIDEEDALTAAYQLLENFTAAQYLQLLARERQRPASPNSEWVATFRSLSTDVPSSGTTLPAVLTTDLGGQRQSRRLVEGTIVVEGAQGAAERHFLLNGEVLRDGRLFESFRARFTLPARAGPAPLSFVRALRPGTYTLIVRVEEPGTERYFRAERNLEVTAPAPPPAMVDAATASAEPSLHLTAPHGAAQGPIRFTAAADGFAPAAVEFRLDGKRVLLKRTPPWSVEIDLGRAARPRRVEAVALDAAGDEILRDERLVNAGDYRFAVRLHDPRPTATASGVRVRAEVSVPAGATVDRLEIWLDDRLVATLYEAPWELPLALPQDGALRVLRAVAMLADGSATEDTALLNAPATAANLDVRLIELFVRVTDRHGAAVHGLGCQDFRLRDSGAEQSLLRCEEAAEQTLHLAVLLDVSASMADRMADAQRAAAAFLEQVLQPRDRALLMAFNDYPLRMVPFTNDLAALHSGLEGLKAERGTALWDAVIRGLQDLGGVTGRRVLLLVSDGEDGASRATFADAEALARESGVVVYAIGIDQPLGTARRLLQRLASPTGGQAFFVRNVAELTAVYTRIADQLRAQYLLAYQPDTTSETFRSVAVEVLRPGTQVEAPEGYLP